MTIKEYAYNDRPYEMLEHFGPQALSDSELLAIILRSGTKDLPATEVAKRLLSNDKCNIGLSYLSQYSINELMKTPGIGKVKAITIVALCEIAKRYKLASPNLLEPINTPDKLARVFMKDLYDKKQEVVMTSIFDVKNRVIKVIVNSIGTVNSNSISVKDILSEPIKMGASKIAVSHNHPSGDTSPSREDITFTKELQKACNLFGIVLIDHIIIGADTFYSLKQHGFF